VADVNANIGINIDTSQSLAEIKNLQRQLAQLYTSINKGSAAAAAAQKGLATNLMNTINAGGKFYAQMGTIRTSTESFTHALEKNKLSMREYFRFAGGSTRTFGKLFKSEFDTIGKVAEERVKRMQTQYIKLGRDASGAMKAISITPTTLNMKEYGNQVAVAAQKQALLNQLLKQGSTNLLNFGKNTQWAGRQLMVGFTIPLAYFGTAAAKTFMDLEAQALKFRRVYGDMFTTTAETEKALGEIRALAEEFTRYGVAVTKTMEMAAAAAAMGKTGAELTAQVANATRLAVLGNVEQEQALETTISLTNAFGIAAEDLANKINFLNSVENQTVTAIEDLTIAIPKAGPVVQQLGGSVEDLAFFLTAMREGGINASEGANALKSGLASLINPTKKASQMLADMGINIKDIVERNQGDLKRTVIDFALALDTLAPLERSRAIEQLFGKFQFARLSTLFQNVTKDGTQAAKVLQLATASVEELAILSERELQAVEDAIGTNFREAVEKLKVSIAPIGKEFLKAITPVVEFLGKLFDKFNNLGDGTKKFIVILTSLVGLIGPTLLMTFGLVANGAANIIKMFILMRQGFLKLAGNSTNLAAQTQYMTTEQQEAAIVAASLNQAHSRLTQQFVLEASAVNQLRNAYVGATTAALRFAATNPGMMIPGFKAPVKGFSKGTNKVPGYAKGTDSVPAMLTPGEAVIPEPIAQDDRFKPLIAALVSGEIAKYEEGTVNVGGKTYTTKSQMAARNLEKKIAQLIAAGISEDKIIRALDKNIERGRPMTGSALEKRLSIGRGSSAGTSAPSAIKRLAKESQSGFRTEVRAIKKVLKQKGITLTPAQEKNLFAVQASHIEEVRNAGIKQWNASNLVADLGYVNNYLNTVKGNLGKNLLAMSDDQLKTLGIDRDELRALQSGRHPTTARAAETLRAVARYDASINPRSYQAQAVLAGLEYRSKSKFYAKPLQTLADVKKTPATLAVGKGETVRTADGRLVKVTGQTGIAKPSGMRVVGGGASDRRVISGANVASVISRGFKGPRLVGAGAQDGIDLTRGVTYGQTAGGLLVPQSALEDALNKNTQSQNLGTDTQDKNTETQEKTAKQLKQEQRQARMQRMSSIGGPVAMAAGTAGMVAAMSGAPQTMTNFLFGISAVAGLLPLLANPLGMAVAGIAALGIAVYKFNADIKKAREEGVALAKSMTMTNEKLIELSKITGSVSATELAKRQRQTVLSGASGVQRKTGQTILESGFGQGLVKDIEKQQKTGASNAQVAKSVGLGLSTAIMQGVLTVEQARSLAAALGEKLGNYDIPARISGTIVSLLGPNGERLESEPLQVALAIKKESMTQQAEMFQNAMSRRQSTITAQNAAGMTAGVGLMAAAGGAAATGVGIPVAAGLLVAGAAATVLSLKNQNDIKAKNLTLDTAAVQLGLETVAQGQGLIDSLNKQYDAKIKQARTAEEIKRLEAERKTAIDAVNKENAKTLDILIKQKDQFTPGAFDAAIKAAADTMYKEGPMAVFKDEAIKALSELENSSFKTTLQLGIASGDMDPNQIIALINMVEKNPDIKTNFDFIVRSQGLAEANVLVGLLEKAGANEQTYKIIMDFIKKNPTEFKDVQDGLSTISNILPKYGITVDINTVGLDQLKMVQRITDTLSTQKEPLTQQVIADLRDAAGNPVDKEIYQDILDNWTTLVGSQDTITKQMVIDFTATYSDPNVKQFFGTSTGIPQTIRGQKVNIDAGQASAYLVGSGKGSQGGGVKPPQTPPSGGTGDRDTTLDNLLTRLKFIRKASINAEGGIKTLMNITKGAGLTKFVGVTQQLMAGPKGGFNREFITFLESMDNKTRKTYMTVKDGQVVLTKQGKALKEAFNEKVIGEYQVAQAQAKQDTLAQGAALAKLKAAGVDSATALEMVSDANLAVAINSKDISSEELQQMAADAKAAKDEMEKLNLEVLGLAESLKKDVGDAVKTNQALLKAREAGIVDPEMLEYISKNASLVNKILQEGTGSETAQSIMQSVNAMKALGEQTEALVNPAQAALNKFSKLKDAAFEAFDIQQRQAQSKFNAGMNRTVNSFVSLNKVGSQFQGMSLKSAIKSAEGTITGLNDQIRVIQDRQIKPIEIQIEAKQRSIDDIMKSLETQAAGMTKGFKLPAAAYKDIAEGLQDQIQGLELDIEFNFKRPIDELQEESSDLSNELTLMDRVIDGINKKYDAQADALEKVSEVNQEILDQQKSQLDIASAITQGDIAAAARAAQDARAQAAATAAKRAGGVLDAARQAEVGAVRSAGGMTREQIEQRQFQISQQIFQLEEQSEVKQRAILALKDQIDAGERAREAFIRETVLPLEREIEGLQASKQVHIDNIAKLEADILRIQYEVLGPLQAEADILQQEYDNAIDLIEQEKQHWLDQETALIIATKETTKFAGEADKVKTAFENAKKVYDDIKNKTVTITVVYNYVGTPPSGSTGNTGNTKTVPQGVFDKFKMYGGKINGYMGGGRVKPIYRPMGGLIPYMNNGGFKPMGSDTVPAMLTPGEYVVNKSSTKAFLPLLTAMNESKFPSSLTKRLFNSAGDVRITRSFNTPNYNLSALSNTQFLQPSYDVNSNTLMNNPISNNISSYSDNSSAVYNYNVGISVGGTDASPDTIAKAVMREIKYIDSQRIRSQRTA